MIQISENARRRANEYVNKPLQKSRNFLKNYSKIIKNSYEQTKMQP